MILTETEFYTLYTKTEEIKFAERKQLEEFAIRNGHAIKNRSGGLTFADGVSFGYTYEIISK